MISTAPLLSTPIFELTISSQNPTNATVLLSADIDDYDGIYEDYFSIVTDNPRITLSPWHCSTEATARYVDSFKQHKNLFMGPCTFTAYIEYPQDLNNTPHLYVTYQLLSEKHMRTQPFVLTNSSTPPNTQDFVQTNNNPIKLTDYIDTSSDIVTIAEVSPSAHTHSLPNATGFLIIAGVMAMIGILLIARSTYAKKCTGRSLLSIIGMALIACSVVLAARAYQAQYKKWLPSNKKIYHS